MEDEHKSVEPEEGELPTAPGEESVDGKPTKRARKIKTKGRGFREQNQDDRYAGKVTDT